MTFFSPEMEIRVYLICMFKNVFLTFLQMLASFFKFSDLLGPAGTRLDAFGCIWMHLDAFRCIRKFSEILGNVSTKKRNFRSVRTFFEGFGLEK